MARTEYYNAPEAPEPNSLVVAASAVVTDDEGRMLLQRRRHNDLWALPGGGMEMADSLPGTAVHEVKEETDLDVEITGLVGVSGRISADPVGADRGRSDARCASRLAVGHGSDGDLSPVREFLLQEPLPFAFGADRGYKARPGFRDKVSDVGFSVSATFVVPH
ncbi:MULTISPECIES: NUDIX domain-containing protein [unclassified Streptomyces]|uniref:NUDIX domain-containing protein n=1 Tax=unclassified Streptomyces TaxID=2593676 RepID=UPI003818E309